MPYRSRAPRAALNRQQLRPAEWSELLEEVASFRLQGLRCGGEASELWRELRHLAVDDEALESFVRATGLALLASGAAGLLPCEVPRSVCAQSEKVFPSVAMIFALLLVPALAAERWSDATNASRSEGNVISCTWGVLCRNGYARQGEIESCGSSFECVPSKNSTNVTRNATEGDRPSLSRSQFYQPFREGSSIWDPSRDAANSKTSGDDITCPCGVRCAWGSRYEGLRQVCNGAVECGICYGR